MADFEEMENAHKRALDHDIVPSLWEYYLNYPNIDRVVCEAAQEIERLREENEHLRTDLKVAMQSNENLLHYLHERRHD